VLLLAQAQHTMAAQGVLCAMSGRRDSEGGLSGFHVRNRSIRTL